jgi:MFS family permease
VSSIGDFLLRVPLTLYLQRTSGSATVVAALFLALWTPAVVPAPFAGWLVDRLEVRAVLIAASLAQAAIAALARVCARFDPGHPHARRTAGSRLRRRAASGGFSLVPVIGGGERASPS